jgi:hypothetical protein
MFGYLEHPGSYSAEMQTSHARASSAACPGCLESPSLSESFKSALPRVLGWAMAAAHSSLGGTRTSWKTPPSRFFFWPFASLLKHARLGAVCPGQPLPRWAPGSRLRILERDAVHAGARLWYRVDLHRSVLPLDVLCRRSQRHDRHERVRRVDCNRDHAGVQKKESP